MDGRRPVGASPPPASAAHRRALTAIVACIALASAAAACGADADTGPVAATSSPSPSSTASEPPFVRAVPEGSYSPDNAPAQPPVPDTAHDYTARGATDFAQYWIDTLNHAWYTGDTTELRRISSPDCQSCSNFIESVENTYGEGNHNSGGGIEVTEWQVLNLMDGWAQLIGTWTAGPDNRVSDSGAVLEHGDPLSATVSIRVDLDPDSGWTVGGMSTTGERPRSSE